MPLVFITTSSVFRLPGAHLDMLARAGFEVAYPDHPELPTVEAAVSALKNADAVLAGSDLYNNEVFDRLPKLRVIARTGVGFDLIDIPSATRHGVAVTITPNANHQGVAEHALALLLAVARSIPQNDREVRSGQWPRLRLIPLRGQTLGLVGLGRIGRSLAVRAQAMQLKVIACDPVMTEARCHELGIRLVSFDELLAESDFVSLHAPMNDSTRGMINRDTLSRMRAGSILINTARGKLVVEEDLAEALRSGHLAGAGLDVLFQEPPPADHPLFSLPNVVITSHTAGADTLAINDMAIAATQNIIDLYEGRWPEESMVNPELRDGWKWHR